MRYFQRLAKRDYKIILEKIFQSTLGKEAKKRSCRNITAGSARQ